MVAKWWFSNSIIPSTFISSRSTLRKSFFFSSVIYLFVCLFNFVIGICGLSFIFLNGLYIAAFIIYFDAQTAPEFDKGHRFKLVFVSFWYAHHSLNTSLFSGTVRCSRLILYCSCPSSGISYFSKNSALVPFGRDTKIWVSSVLVSSRPFQRTELV